MNKPKKSSEDITTREARFEDLDQILLLLPRLANFEVPGHRESTDLWHGDAEMMKAWARNERHGLVVMVAVDGSGDICGVGAASDCEDLLTAAKSSHLELLAVSKATQRRGIGRRLLTDIEAIMFDRGANGMSLHVFSNNTKARKLYTNEGFNEEIVRCYKPFNS